MSKPKGKKAAKHHPYCQGCIYAVFAGCEPVCDYFLMTKHRRPCPPGEGCTVRTMGKDRRVGDSWR